MKERLQGLIAGIAAGVVAAGPIGAFAAFAAYYTATDNSFPITYNGNRISLQGYNIDGSTYFKLRDIANVVGGFNVEFENNTIVLKDDRISNPNGNTKADTNLSVSNINNNSANIKYDTAFTLNKYYSTGRWWRTTDVQSFKITNTELSYSGDLKITYEIIGVVTGSDYCSIDVKCYDKDGFVIDTDYIIGDVVDGQQFKIKNIIYIPAETVRFEFVDN